MGKKILKGIRSFFHSKDHPSHKQKEDADVNKSLSDWPIDENDISSIDMDKCDGIDQQRSQRLAQFKMSDEMVVSVIATSSLEELDDNAGTYAKSTHTATDDRCSTPDDRNSFIDTYSDNTKYDKAYDPRRIENYVPWITRCQYPSHGQCPSDEETVDDQPSDEETTLQQNLGDESSSSSSSISSASDESSLLWSDEDKDEYDLEELMMVGFVDLIEEKRAIVTDGFGQVINTTPRRRLV